MDNNSEVLRLLDMVEETRKKNLVWKQTMEDEYWERVRENEKTLKSIQEMCNHSTTRIEEDHNYHRNEVWTEVYCTVCDKYLKRY